MRAKSLASPAFSSSSTMVLNSSCVLPVLEGRSASGCGLSLLFLICRVGEEECFLEAEIKLGSKTSKKVWSSEQESGDSIFQEGTLPSSNGCFQ